MVVTESRAAGVGLPMVLFWVAFAILTSICIWIINAMPAFMDNLVLVVGYAVLVVAGRKSRDWF